MVPASCLSSCNESMLLTAAHCPPPVPCCTPCLSEHCFPPTCSTVCLVLPDEQPDRRCRYPGALPLSIAATAGKTATNSSAAGFSTPCQVRHSKQQWFHHASRSGCRSASTAARLASNVLSIAGLKAVAATCHPPTPTHTHMHGAHLCWYEAQGCEVLPHQHPIPPVDCRPQLILHCQPHDSIAAVCASTAVTSLLQHDASSHNSTMPGGARSVCQHTRT